MGHGSEMGHQCHPQLVSCGSVSSGPSTGLTREWLGNVTCPRSGRSSDFPRQVWHDPAGGWRTWVSLCMDQEPSTRPGALGGLTPCGRSQEARWWQLLWVWAPVHVHLHLFALQQERCSPGEAYSGRSSRGGKRQQGSSAGGPSLVPIPPSYTHTLCGVSQGSLGGGNRQENPSLGALEMYSA